MFCLVSTFMTAVRWVIKKKKSYPQILIRLQFRHIAAVPTHTVADSCPPLLIQVTDLVKYYNPLCQFPE